MKRLPLFGLILALAASCGTSLESSEQAVACYDTGSGMKCVALKELPAGTTAACIDNDGVTDASASSASGPSASDDDTSASSDSPGLRLTEDDDDSSAEDASGASDSTSESTEDGCSGGADGDGDGVSDSQDCDCLDPDSPTNVPPPTGDGGPIII